MYIGVTFLRYDLLHYLNGENALVAERMKLKLYFGPFSSMKEYNLVGRRNVTRNVWKGGWNFSKFLVACLTRSTLHSAERHQQKFAIQIFSHEKENSSDDTTTAIVCWKCKLYSFYVPFLQFEKVFIVAFREGSFCLPDYEVRILCQRNGPWKLRTCFSQS